MSIWPFSTHILLKTSPNPVLKCIFCGNCEAQIFNAKDFSWRFLLYRLNNSSWNDWKEMIFSKLQYLIVEKSCISQISDFFIFYKIFSILGSKNSRISKNAIFQICESQHFTNEAKIQTSSFHNFFQFFNTITRQKVNIIQAFLQELFNS